MPEAGRAEEAGCTAYSDRPVTCRYYPIGQGVSKQTKKMFYMVSTDLDAFRRFVFETKCLAIYDIDQDMVDSVRVNDEALLQLGFDWLRNVMFNEPTIAMRQDILQQAIGKAREGLGGAKGGGPVMPVAPTTNVVVNTLSSALLVDMSRNASGLVMLM